MTQEAPPSTGLTHELTTYLDVVKRLTADVWLSRSGFSALKKLDSVFYESVRLVLSSSLFVGNRNAGAWPWGGGLDPESLEYIRHPFGPFPRRWPEANVRQFFEQLLGTPVSFDPRPFWSLFWALAKAEHQFLVKHIPFWSNEERLTGHLVSQMSERLDEFGDHWIALSDADARRDTRCEVWYADTATARQEKITGADLGLIVHGKIPNQREFFKVARFQAKKADVNGRAVIDLDQIEALTQTDELGYMLFYHQLDAKRWCPAPTVMPASHFRSAVEAARSKPSLKGSLGKVPVDARDGGWDFATFVTFGVGDPSAECGVLAEDAVQAVRTVTSGGNARPTRLLVITLGGGSSVTDWNAVGDEYLGLHDRHGEG